MFRNSGKKIMAFAGFLFWVNLVLVVLLVVGVGVYSGLQSELETAVMTCLAAAMGGVVYLLLTYWLTLCLYSYGELVQSNCEIRELLAKQQLAPERPGRRVTASAQPAPQQPAPQGKNAADVELFDWTNPDPSPLAQRGSTYAYDYKAPAGAPAASVAQPVQQPAYQEPVVEGDKIRCPRCGAKHDPAAQTCRYCATPLH